MKKTTKVLIVCGGVSTEREISLKSGQYVYDALIRKGYVNSSLFILDKDNLAELLSLHPDIVFLALHGRGGEDGCIQGVLELAGIPYTGSGVACSAICMDKTVTKRILESAGLPTAKYIVISRRENDDNSEIAKELIVKIGLPMVLKSPCQGSSIGVVIVRDENEIIDAVCEVFKYGDILLAEEYLDGVEVTLSIMGNEYLTVLPVIEITSERDFYDYKAKYTSGLCHHIIPACITSCAEKEIIEIGKRAYKLLNCKGLSRIDFIVDKQKGPMIIEVNTLPGMTDMSLFPDAARYAGMPYDTLVEKITELGLSAHRDLQ